MKRNKIRIFFGAVLTIVILSTGVLLGGCTCRASVKPAASAVPTRTATMAPAATVMATAGVTVVPVPSGTPTASDLISPSMSPMTSDKTGSGTP